LSSGETTYSFRRVIPDVLQRGRANVVRMEAYRDGAMVVITSGTLSLIDSGGNVVSSPAVSIHADGYAYATIPAVDLPSTLAYGTSYRELWTLTMPDLSVPIVPRECAVAKFQLFPDTCDLDLTGEYPGLLVEFGGSIASLQPFIDKAWRHIIRRLWSMDIWPEVIVSETQLAEPLEQYTYYLAFKALFRKTSGNNRWETLMGEHRANFDAAWSSMTWKRDLDQSGVADDDSRSHASAVVTPNVPPYSAANYRDPRW